MIISNCPKHTIEAAATEVGLLADINTLSPSGLRHRVKLYPSASKPHKVEAGTRIFYSHTRALREKLSTAWVELNLPDDPKELLYKLSQARLPDLLPTGYERIPYPILLQAQKLARAICGRERTYFKRIAPFQRRSASNSDRAVCAVCWHGFRDFFRALFAFKPDANAYTAFSKYRGLDGFLANYPATAHKNIGSAYNPMLASEACWCEG